jgi:hypothetical protein
MEGGWGYLWEEERGVGRGGSPTILHVPRGSRFERQCTVQLSSKPLLDHTLSANSLFRINSRSHLLPGFQQCPWTFSTYCVAVETSFEPPGQDLNPFPLSVRRFWRRTCAALGWRRSSNP